MTNWLRKERQWQSNSILTGTLESTPTARAEGRHVLTLGEKLREERQMESAKMDMLVFKQMIYELKAVLVMEKDKKVKKALQEEIRANKDIVKMMIRSGVPDVPLRKRHRTSDHYGEKQKYNTTGIKVT